MTFVRSGPHARAIAWLMLAALLAFSWANAQQVGDPLPDFRLADADGVIVTPASLRGAPLVLNVWATWCPPCKAELPMLAAMAEATQDRGLVLMLLDAGEPRSAAQAFLDAEGLPLRTLVDADADAAAAADAADVDLSLDVVRRLGARGLPSTFFIDADGVVQAKWTGLLTPAVLAKSLATIGVDWVP